MNLLPATLLVSLACAALAAPMDDASFVVTSTEPSSVKEPSKEGSDAQLQNGPPHITEMHVHANVSNRFAHTTVASKVKNFAQRAQEVQFSVVLPETAFISGFIMEVGGKNYTAYVKEKEEAKKDYEQAVQSGLSAAQVAASARDSNRFTVSLNAEPESKISFWLNYEELLQRRDGRYELVVNLHPGQPVKDLTVQVEISESRKLTDLKAPPLRSGNEIGSNDKTELDPRAVITVVNDTSVIVRFDPDVERQKQFANALQTKEDEGLSGQFVVQYDVERDPTGGEVLVQDGYFVHFFAPTEIEPLSKHVVFVLDTSGSMYGTKMEQLHEAMSKILDQLNEKDLLTLVEFNTNVKVWNLDNDEASAWYPNRNDDWRSGESNVSLSDVKFPSAYLASKDNIKKAKETVMQMVPTGGTDIFDALKVGLHLVELAQPQSKDADMPQPIVVFLTDGDPTVGVTSTEQITSKISEFNSGVRKSPIFALSFGAGADKNFLQKLALRNSGFNKHIYEAADASLQLQDFYRQISSPLLANVTFKYAESVKDLTVTDFPIHFRGSELVVSGWCGTTDEFARPEVDAWGKHGPIVLRPTVERAITSLERLWAYLTVKQLLEKKEASDADKEKLKKKALDIALKHSFVTDVSSLVVVKPNDTANAVNAESAQSGNSFSHAVALSSASASGGPVSGFALRPAAAPQLNMVHHLSLNTYISKAESMPDAGMVVGMAAGIPGPPALPVTTPFATSARPTTTKATEPNGLFAALPWLESALSEHGSLTAPNAWTAAAPAVAFFAPASNRIAGGYMAVNSAFEDAEEDAVPSTTANSDPLGLPWLTGALNANGLLNVSGGEYKLGLNETVTDNVKCPKTPLDKEGSCKLLKDCPDILPLLTDKDVYLKYFCPLNEFAGVCCPVA